VGLGPDPATCLALSFNARSKAMLPERRIPRFAILQGTRPIRWGVFICEKGLPKMPAYKNRPPMDPNTPVWRHLSLNSVVATIRDRNLRFTRVDQFPDPFEGSVPKSQIDGQVVAFSGANAMRMMFTQVAAHYPGMSLPPHPDEDDWTRMTRLRRAMTRSVHASCWSAGHESEALWRLYCHDNGTLGLGVALRTTLQRLESSVAPHDLYVSPVTYRLYHEGDVFTDNMDAFMHKRRGFAAEREVRLLLANNQQYSALIQRPPAAPELPPHLHLDWPVGAAIEEIVLSPYADEPYEVRARAAIAAADPRP
jgi:hypothetical protein